MAILDKENRPRGLRVPSFARKGFKQKSSDSLPDKEPEQVQAPVTTVIPPRTDSAPDYSAPAPLPAAVQPPSSAFNAPIHHQDDLPQPAPPAANYTPAPRAYQAYRPPATSEPVQSPPARKEVPLPALPAIQRPDAEEPLEDFIPEPEPELDDTGAPIEPVSSEENNGPWTPPDIEPVAAPLNKLHFACYQDHRSMPPANNVWHAVPCMTCQKFDRDVRYRCVFCCLRICTGCFQTLQTIPRRSLAQLMESIPAAKA
ncbi:hypothetical protein AtubIFM55763_010788 [Aspergillus tubingensis]|uniref:Uncharacterized protein n=3 Tax=Aspergillus subgen. Circumdati TaxID=2720871 RepID=A0A1L9N4T6_ASPTC|nr:similar to An16g08890 [Aspergillus tubingensis]OJI84256.1 hypothetical protein ASPTUDRAFT_120658 [Aspergillus tubingensis CBS 134.48]GAQ43556.1 similar to An16g08890 [Aspergillus niger]GFN20217.1 similar to An16g08890 [Aspergillus tubingensis]GLA59552.1 hypothetical protein AtubIFM54640_010673 [Aspergillus tubingensis]GLA69887.1 hypothetical protein AtubIFM55763_010788 [Aspergillus tubingensis]